MITNSFQKILKENYNGKIPQLLDESEAIHLFLERFDELGPFKSNEYPLDPQKAITGSFIPFFNRMRDELINPKGMSTSVTEDINEEMGNQLQDLINTEFTDKKIEIQQRGKHGIKLMVDPNFWNGKRVFITGHTGFKGSWLSIWLTSMGSIVKGYSLQPPTSPSLYVEAKVDELIESSIGDIRNQEELANSMLIFDPEILIHMAAQPLVRYSYDEPIETYEVNVIGTAKVLEVARSCKRLKAIINITTDKCYENLGFDKSFNETDPMGGVDPYSSSKGCAELVTASYRRSFFKDLGIGVASARAGNVIGGGDWADDRLIPDILKSFENGEKVLIRNPQATRPWQHVLEPLSGYLILAQKLFIDPLNFSQGWNFGPKEEDVKPVKWIVDKMATNWPQASWELETNAQPHEAEFLKLDIAKAKINLNWSPVWSLETTLEKIIMWHRAWLNDENIQKLSINEINEYMDDMNCERY